MVIMDLAAIVSVIVIVTTMSVTSSSSNLPRQFRGERFEEKDHCPRDDHVVIRSDNARDGHHGDAHPAKQGTKIPHVDGTGR